MKYYLFLTAAIICEVIGTSFLKKTEQFTKLGPTLILITAFIASFYFLSMALKGIPLGIAYAIWSAFGIVIISLVGFFVYNEKLDLPAVLGILLIVSGVVVIRMFSNSAVE